MNRLAYSSIVAVSLFSASFAHAVAPSVKGSWKVTFYLENARSTGATQCITFNPPNGAVSGVPTSGTWQSPSFPDWKGQWIQLGDHVRWFGVTSGIASEESGNVANNNMFSGVSFNHFNKTTGLNSSAGTWSAVRVANCNSFTDTGSTSVDEDPSHK